MTFTGTKYLAVFALLLPFLCAAQELNLANLPPVAPVVDCTSLRSADLSAAVGAHTTVDEASVATEPPIPYCRVKGTIAPQIHFSVTLPVIGWTQRFLQVGCSGVCGQVPVIPDQLDLETGDLWRDGRFALAASDLGHQSSSSAFYWAAQNPKARLDFAYRGAHLTALAAKALIEKYYGQNARFSYLAGFLEGGREALMEAQRYPTDFDGISAGAPDLNIVTQDTFYQAWSSHVNTGADGKAILIADRLPILHRGALAACDAADGLTDGIISDPLNCHFDPATLVCHPGQSSTDCLSKEQSEVARLIYQGARDSQGQRLVLSGPLPGSELGWRIKFVPDDRSGVAYTGDSAHIALGALRNLAYMEPLPATFKLADFQFDQAAFEALMPAHLLYDATDPALNQFAGLGHKLLLWDLWPDIHNSPLNTIAYYTAIQQTLGAERVGQFAQLYINPDATGTTSLISLMAWVEKNLAPAQLIARRYVQPPAVGGLYPAGKVVSTRPVYPYPAFAVYKGSGSPDQAENFQPLIGPLLDPERLNWLGSSFSTRVQ